MGLSSMIVPTRTVYCCLQPLQRHRKRAFREPSLAFIIATSVSPQRGQLGVSPHRCASRNATAAASLAHASGMLASRAVCLPATLGMTLLYYTHARASSSKLYLPDHRGKANWTYQQM